jgi:hypothetical protein
VLGDGQRPEQWRYFREVAVDGSDCWKGGVGDWMVMEGKEVRRDISSNILTRYTYLQLVCLPVAAVQHTFTHKQYTEHDHMRYIECYFHSSKNGPHSV